MKIMRYKWAILGLSLWGLVTNSWARRMDLNQDWRFFKGPVTGAEDVDFNDVSWNDVSWRHVDIPHDWSIEDRTPESGPFDPCAIGGCKTGYTVGGTAWYRKHFTLDPNDRGRRVHMHFDGVYSNADVWINGTTLGRHPYGYTAFWYDVTPEVRFGADNVLAVQVRNEGVNSRWYSGSGIYRPAWLMIMNPVHIAHWGPVITTPQVTAKDAQVRVRTTVRNESGRNQAVTLYSRILNPAGQTIAETRSTLQDSLSFDQMMAVKRPLLWSPQRPSLYQVLQQVMVAGRVVDERWTTFGIRSITCDARQGFKLNGQSILLQGMCMHHDNYMLGAAAYRRAEERRVQIAKAAGYNAIRCTHNPPSTAFLEACDRLGMLVIDEAFDQWNRKKNKQDYHLFFSKWWQRDLSSMLQRDRNHPSVIMWSLGNEIPEQHTKLGAKTAAQLAAYVRSWDQTRPVTLAANMSGPGGDAFFTPLDVVGYNYQRANYVSDHKRVPERVMFGSESFSAEAFDYWAPVEAHPYIIGDFVWTGWDYLGEAAIGWVGYKPNWSATGPYPWHLAYCGEIDACGFKRPAAYYREVLWHTGHDRISAFVKSPTPSLQGRDPNNHLMWVQPDLHPSWTWPGYQGRDLQVVVYCDTDQAELRLNGHSLGRQPTTRQQRYTAVWRVPYQPGQLEALALQDDHVQSHWTLRTAGPPTQLHLTPDRSRIKADGQDLSYVTVEVQDARGVRVPQAAPLIHFTIQGAGSLAGVGNGKPYGTESFQQPQCTAFHGRGLVVLKSTRHAGAIKLTATASELKPDTVVIQATVP